MYLQYIPQARYIKIPTETLWRMPVSLSSTYKMRKKRDYFYGDSSLQLFFIVV